MPVCTLCKTFKIKNGVKIRDINIVFITNKLGTKLYSIFSTQHKHLNTSVLAKH